MPKAEAVSVVDSEDVVDMVDMVDMVEAVEAVELETAMKLSAQSAKLTVILQMHEEAGNALRREETTMSAVVSSAGFQDISKSIVSLNNVSKNGERRRKALLMQLLL